VSSFLEINNPLEAFTAAPSSENRAQEL
jgi:hypothetical protein